MSHDTIGLDFIHWLDRAKPGGIIPWPQRRAKDAVTALAIGRGATTGRVTLWLWQAPNRVKVALAMARIAGEGGDKPVRTIHGAPPYRDDDKAQVVFQGERE